MGRAAVGAIRGSGTARALSRPSGLRPTALKSYNSGALAYSSRMQSCLDAVSSGWRVRPAKKQQQLLHGYAKSAASKRVLYCLPATVFRRLAGRQRTRKGHIRKGFK